MKSDYAHSWNYLTSLFSYRYNILCFPWGEKFLSCTSLAEAPLLCGSVYVLIIYLHSKDPVNFMHDMYLK